MELNNDHSRRDFLKLIGYGMLGLLASRLSFGSFTNHSVNVEDMTYRISFINLSISFRET
ncbi:MAG: hypothetical protein WBB23_04335 [Desulforhopalus sp.]